MNKTVSAGTLALSMLLDGGQNALATEKPIELGDTTKQIKLAVENCMGSGMFKFPNGDCGILVDYIAPEDTQTPTEILIEQHKKEGAEKQIEELWKFWGLVLGSLGLGLTLCNSMSNLVINNLEQKEQKLKLNELLEELKNKMKSMNKNYTNSFMNLKSSEIAQISRYCSLCEMLLVDDGEKIEKEDTEIYISNLQELINEIDALDLEFEKFREIKDV